MRRGAALAAFAALAAANAATAGSRPHTHPAGDFAAAMHGAMLAMMQAMDRAPMTGDPDRDFLAMMIPHHAGAIEMARLVLIYGRDPLVRQLAEEIIAEQQAEIDSMQARLARLGQGAGGDADGFPALEGTRGPAAEPR